MLTNFEYNNTVISKREDGYINLSSMCRANDRKLHDFTRLKSSKAYLEELSEATGIPVGKLLNVQNGSETWGYPSLAIRLAQWISPKFAVWCDAHIFNLMESGSTSLEIDPIAEMKLKIELARLETQKEQYRAFAAKNEKETLELRKHITKDLPKPVADRILGVTEVKEIEYRDRTFLEEDLVNDGSTITQSELCRHLGFVKNEKAQIARLKKFFKESGIDRDQSFWTKTSNVITHRQIRKEKLEEIEELHNRSVRQMFLAEQGAIFE